MHADHRFFPDEPLASKVEIVSGALLVPYNDVTKRGRVHLGGVYRPDLSFVDNSKLFISESRQVNRARAPGDLSDIPTRSGLWLFGGKLDTRFGHFLLETLSRLWALDHVSEPVQGVVFMPPKVLSERRAQKQFKAMQPLFHLIDGLPPCEVLTQRVRFERLIVPPQGCGTVAMAPGCPELKWSQKTGQLAKVYPEPVGGIRDGETPEVHRSVQGEGRT